MDYSGSCSVCHKRTKISDSAGDAVCGKEQLKVCSQVCEQHLQYCLGFAHGFIVFQVLGRLCGNPFTRFSSNKGQLGATATGSFTVAENDRPLGNTTDDAFSNATIKREPKDMGRSDDDVTGLKVFFEKHVEHEPTKAKCVDSERAITALWSATSGKNAETGLCDKEEEEEEEEEVVADFPEQAQNCSEDEDFRVSASGEKSLLKCSSCPATFPAGADLKLTQHRCQIHPKEGGFTCDTCGAVFKERGLVNRHKGKVHGKLGDQTESGKYQCEKCGRKCTTKNSLRDHLQRTCITSDSKQASLDRSISTSGQSSETKVLSSKRKASTSSSSQHERSDSEREGFQCRQCDKNYPSGKALQCHVQRAHTKPAAASKCATCRLSFGNKLLLKQHKASEHCGKGQDGESPTFPCDQCGKECPSRKSLLHHVRFLHAAQTPADCKVCWRTYRNARLAREHTRTVHRVRLISGGTQERLLRCTFCPETFPAGAKERVADHLRERHSQEMAPALSCEICGDKFKRKFTLDYHRRNTHWLGLMDSEAKHRIQREKMHPCDKCGKTLSKNSMRRHVLMFHSKHVPADCKVCGKKLRSALHLERHMRCHRSLPSRVCHVCGVHLKTDQGLKSHLAAHKGVKSHVCEVCGAGFVRRTSWQRHVRQHSDTVFQCDVCAKSFTTDYALHTHMLSRHQRGAYFNNRLRTVEELGYAVDKEAVGRHLNHQCVVCGGNLSAGKCPAHPTDFMLMFDCDKCGLRAKHIEFLCHHLKTHHHHHHHDPVRSTPSSSSGPTTKNYSVWSSTSQRGEAVMAYACKVCHKSFQRREYVSHHMRQHEEKTFACPVCERKFTYKCNMKNHLLTHSEDKPYQCPVCRKGFKRPALLKCHARVHDPNRSPFKCQVCGKGLTRKQYLQQHYRLVHPELQLQAVSPADVGC